MTALPKYTPGGLPIVTQETANMLARDLTGANPISDKDLAAIIYAENRFITTYISLTVLDVQRRGASKDVVQATKLGMLNVYELLRRQADANKLEEMYNGNSSE